MSENSSDRLYSNQFPHHHSGMPPFGSDDSAFEPASSYMFDEEDQQFQAAMHRGLVPFSQGPGGSNTRQPYYAMSGTR
jgi:hypothetical protein